MKRPSSRLFQLCSYERLLQGLWLSSKSSRCVVSVGSGAVSRTHPRARTRLTLARRVTPPFSGKTADPNRILPLLSAVLSLHCSLVAYLLYLFCHTTSVSPYSYSNAESIAQNEIFFLFLLLLIIPILCWGVVHPLLKLDNQNNVHFLGNPHLRSHLISVWKTHAEICWQWSLRSGCVANSLLFYEKEKKTWESDRRSPNSKTRNMWQI